MSECNYLQPFVCSYRFCKVQNSYSICHSKFLRHSLIPHIHTHLFLFWEFHPTDFYVRWKWLLHGLVLHGQVCPGQVLQLLLACDWEWDPRSLSRGWHREFRYPLHGLEFHPIAEMVYAQESAQDKSQNINLSHSMQ